MNNIHTELNLMDKYRTLYLAIADLKVLSNAKGTVVKTHYVVVTRHVSMHLKD